MSVIEVILEFVSFQGLFFMKLKFKHKICVAYIEDVIESSLLSNVNFA